MMTLSKTAAATLEILVAGLEPGTSRTIGDGNVFMAVVVERLTRDHYSVAHYYEQNGDLVPDPDVTYWRSDSGAFVPTGITQWSGHRTAVKFEGGKPARFSPKEVRDLCSFSSFWMRNIRHQQAAFFATAKRDKVAAEAAWEAAEASPLATSGNAAAPIGTQFSLF